MKKQNGFTLIELVVVIAILGILAAIALPKFVDLTGDARRAKIQAAQGAINAASALAHAKFLASGSADSTFTAEGVSIKTINGYPTAATIAEAAGIGSDYFVAGAAGTEGSGATRTINTDASHTSCSVTYKEAVSTTTGTGATAVTTITAPEITLVVSGC